MGSARGAARAGQADRDKAIELINEAYARSELTEAQRETRVARALRARTLPVLAKLTADLQGARPGDFHRGSESAATSNSQTRTSRRALIVWTVLGTLVALGLLVLVLGLLFGRSSEPKQGRPMLTAKAADELIDRYQDEFGTSGAFMVELYDTWARVHVPADTGKTRFYEYYYDPSDGEFSKNRGGSASSGMEMIDLAQVDVPALMSSVAVAERDLGGRVDPEGTSLVIAADSGESWWAQTRRSQGAGVAPHILIRVTNEFDETGFMLTDLQGRVQFKVPIGDSIQKVIPDTP